MWIFMNDAMLSIVENRDDPATLLVRARREGDIERTFPLIETFTDVTADYLFRAFVPREMVAEVLADRLANIDYTNFKGSIPIEDEPRHRAYMGVWGVMHDLQVRENRAAHEAGKEQMRFDVGI